MECKLSVIIPVYNQEELVIRAIKSVPCRNDVEIIVIDDYSTDNTLLELRDFQKRTDYNLVVLANDKNQGVGYTVNRGLDVATGEYVVFLGSDDYFVNLDKCIDFIFDDKVDLIYFDLEINDGSFWKLSEESKWGLCGSTKFMRREFIGETREPEMRQGEDWYFYRDLMAKNPTEKFVNRNVVYKHYNFPREGSLTWIASNK